MTDDTPSTTRRKYLKATAAAPLAITPDITIPSLSSDTLTPLVTAPEATPITHTADAHPSVIVRYEEGKRDSVTEWIDSGDERALLTDHPNTRQITLRAPWDDIGVAKVLGRLPGRGGLQAKSYVESIDLNTRRSIPDPVGQLASAAEVGHDLGRVERYRTPAATTSGLAFSKDAATATLQRSRNLVQAPDSLLDGVDTSTLTVGIIDTGCDPGVVFEDGSGNTRIPDASKNFITGETVGTDGLNVVAAGDDSDHGTWVSACIAARDSGGTYRGLADQASLLVCKALDDDGSGETSHIVEAVNHCIDHGADVINLSLGSAKWSEALADALTDAAEAGVFAVCATGNSRYSTTWVASPADSEDAFGVNATNVPESGNRDDTKIAYFGCIGEDPGSTDVSGGASTGAQPHLAAPGMAVEAELPAGTSALSGTSMAAPHVAGAAALVRADTGATVEETWRRLTECAYPLPRAGTTETEFGLLDVDAALSDSPYPDSQADVRDDDAKARDEFNRTYSDAQGGVLMGLF